MRLVRLIGIGLWLRVLAGDDLVGGCQVACRVEICAVQLWQFFVEERLVLRLARILLDGLFAHHQYLVDLPIQFREILVLDGLVVAFHVVRRLYDMLDRRLLLADLLHGHFRVRELVHGTFDLLLLVGRHLCLLRDQLR